ncbi:zinc-ribbon domain-containing protein [Bacillus sp. OR9]|nr:zinc-ribbon domain-containing protein [Bacillus sp. OR9]
MVRIEKKLSEEAELINAFPDIAKEWYATKNGKLTPDDVPYGSEKHIW